LVQDISEISVKFKNPKRKLITVDYKGREEHVDFHHQLIKVTLKQGAGQFAMDFTGAQYGYFAPVVPWQEYYDSRVREMVYGLTPHVYFGGFKKHLEAQKCMPGFEGACTRLNMMGSDWMKGQVDVLQNVAKLPIPGFLKFPQPKFDAVRKLLVADLKEMYSDGMVKYLADQMETFKKSGRKGKMTNVLEEYEKLGIVPFGA
jgi:hypothetical protein